MTKVQPSVSPDDFLKIILPFLKEILPNIPPFAPDEAFKNEVFNKFAAASGLPEDTIPHFVDTGKVLARCFYPSLSRDLQISIGVLTAYVFSIDDQCADPEFREQLKPCRTVFLGKSSTNLQYIKGLYKTLHDIVSQYEWYAGDMIINSTMDFLSINIVEAERTGEFVVSPSTKLFPDFLRRKSGIGEAYAFFYFPKSDWKLGDYFTLIPDIAGIIEQLNDVLSFYKESVLGNEPGTWIRQTSVCRGISEYEVFQERVDQCLGSIRRLRAACEGNPRLLKTVNEFINGYPLFHLNAGRYKLDQFGSYDGWLNEKAFGGN
ncbi:terpenoid synthase [Aspergillus neoniger CBS 115656]|uniref:Terpenoid synthase n=1 Tax=Aspergillus neoniger (strain CBS 115656) TaxID=1448310 RepID=A0A318YWM3_ASPNB|nr:terpenoid synthase [Aspergillus neoniger CBS 115656]PYH37213.1 terpenoid synthase [Aspergillus neoniger CBS 115656]